MSFNELGLAAELLRAVEEKGYTQPTPIQQQAIPIILDGRDLLASARTGTGKTAGFMLPILQKLMSGSRSGPRPRVLVLTPTRELAAQVGDSARTYGRHLEIRTSMIFGGVSIRPQIAELKRGVDIVVATPGRLLDHVEQRTIDLREIRVLVLDEADRMLDMGFIRDIRRIMQRLPKRRQNLLFSATFSREIRSLANDFLVSPAEVDTAPRNSAAERVRQIVYPVDRERKRELLSHRIGAENWQQVLVFARTKHGADRLARQLAQDGLDATAIHGRKTQAARTRALADFKSGRVRVLVATDVAARGLDISGLPHVINFELPDVPEDYVHRIGRTARAGQDGQAISLVCIDELKLLRAIEQLLKTKIEQQVIPGYEVDPNVRPQKIQRGRPEGGRPEGGRSGGGRSGGSRRGDGQRAQRSPGPRPKSRQRKRPAGGGGSRGGSGSGNAAATSGSKPRSQPGAKKSRPKRHQRSNAR